MGSPFFMIMTKQEAINGVVSDWVEEFIFDLGSSASNKVGRDTGASTKSFDVDMVRARAQQAAVVSAMFLGYLRLYDMRKVQRRNQLTPDGIERIKAWVRRKGVQNFMKGYKGKTQVKKNGQIVDVDVTRLINNIAWGISKRKRRIKPRKWYNKKKGYKVYEFYYQCVNAVAEAVADEYKMALGKILIEI